MYTVTKSISADFPQGFHSGELRTAINADTAVTPYCFDVMQAGDEVRVLFDATLSPAELSALSSVVTTHTGPPLAKTPRQWTSFVLTSRKKPYVKVDDDDYKLLAYLPYSGSTDEGTIIAAKAFAWLEESSATGKLLLQVRGSPDVTIADELVITGEEEKVWSFANIRNIPADESVLLLYGKCDEDDLLVGFISYGV